MSPVCTPAGGQSRSHILFCAALPARVNAAQATRLPSMGAIGDFFDNAMAESFFASLECELLD